MIVLHLICERLVAGRVYWWYEIKCTEYCQFAITNSTTMMLSIARLMTTDANNTGHAGMQYSVGVAAA